MFSWRFRRRRWLLLIAVIFFTFSPGEVPSATPEARALQLDLRRVNERNQTVLSRAIHRIFLLAA